jgi:hypothetical protein
MSGTTECSAGAVRPFTIPVTAEEELEALRARLTATRWPDPELVTDFFRACSRGDGISATRPTPDAARAAQPERALRND